MISIILNLLNLFYGIAWYMLVNISVSLINTLQTCDVNINNGKVAKSVVERCLCMGKWLSPWKGREVKADWQTGEWARVGVAQSRTRLKRLSSSSSSSRESRVLTRFQIRWDRDKCEGDKLESQGQTKATAKQLSRRSRVGAQRAVLLG